VTTAAIGPDRVRALVDWAASVAAQTDLKNLLGATVDAAMELTGARYGALGELGEHGTLAQFVYRGIDEETARAIGNPPAGRGVLGGRRRTGQSFRLDRIGDHPASFGFPANHPPMSTFLGVPVRAGEAIFGNLYLTEKPGGFTEQDQSIVEALASIAGAAVNTLRLQSRLRRLAIADDRERIARDIHDAIIQDLFAVGISLQAMASRNADQDLAAALLANATRVDDSIAALRQFIFDLGRPPADQRNLRGEVEDLVHRVAEPHATDIALTINGAFRGLPGAYIDDTLQLIREALSNALRHSEATAITVEIHESGAGIGITVTDDGSGFDLSQTTPGLGLANLASRTERAGGELSIDTKPGSGTTIRATIPYER